jgi:hypothetical protein
MDLRGTGCGRSGVAQDRGRWQANECSDEPLGSGTLQLVKASGGELPSHEYQCT